MLLRTILFLVLSSFSVSVFAQVCPGCMEQPLNMASKETPKTIGYPIIDERCGTVHMHEYRQQQQNAESDAAFEEWIERKIQETDFLQRDIITIPVVVHVIHNGEAIGTSPNISDAQVISQINVLNQDFRRILGTNGYNDHLDGADVEMEFCMAVIDPSGNPSNGINRQDLGNDGWSNNQIESNMKPNTIWDPEQYFNIWVCEFSSASLLGYAQFPSGSGLPGLGGGAASTDGVVIGAPFFGTSDEDDGSFSLNDTYDLGRTLTHEAGHFFGLRHIWGDGGCGEDDYCADTPDSDDSNGGCPTNHVSCTSVDMIENYMDYTYDACMNIFTNDQKARILTVMENSPRRANLKNSIVCNPPPLFSFNGQVIDAETGVGIAGAGVKFSGALSPETTTGADGLFNFPNIYEGEYEIFAGNWGYITTSISNAYFDENSGLYTIELDQGYYDDFALDFNWTVSGNAETGSWEKVIPSGSYYNGIEYDPSSDIDSDLGNECYLTGNAGGGGAGSNDVDNGTTTLTSPVFDATLYTSPIMSFYRLFATGAGQGATPDDVLEISLTNGSETVVLETVDINSDDLFEWVYKEFLMSNYIALTNNMQLIITTSDQVGNDDGHLVDAAIDLFRVEEASNVSVDNTLADELNFSLQPNPSQGEFIVQLENIDEAANIRIYDALGRKILEKNASNGNTNINISQQANGIYFLQVNVSGRSFVKKVVKE
jgi:hypothetical protein